MTKYRESKAANTSKTYDRNEIEASTGNIYEALSIIANRSQQINLDIKNLVEEFNDPEWVRGGTPTRQIVKDLDYLQRGRDSDENKEYIKGKKAYVHKCLKQ